MEGTRNERVVILVLSYIIGFVTAYIAFGLTPLTDSWSIASIPTTNTAAVMNSAPKKVDTRPLVATTKQGLVLIKNNQEIYLSSHVEAGDDTFLDEGYHVKLADYELSPDGEFVYFCEVPAVDADSCRPYLYSIAEDITYPVKIDGERVAFSADGGDVYWGSNGILVVK